MKWRDLTPFPENAIYPKRIEQMEREWGGYKPELVGSPAVFDNSTHAFPDLPVDALLVGDGNHRRELALKHNQGDAEILADLHLGLSRPEMHHRRRGLNDRRSIKPAERFIEMAQENLHGPEEALKKEVESLGWEISHNPAKDHAPSCVRELMWIRAQNRKAMIRTITTYESTWGTKSSKIEAKIIKGLGAFWLRYPNADEGRLVHVLKTMSQQKLYEAGKSQKDLLSFLGSVHDGIRYVITQAYNHKRRKDILPI